MSTEDDKTLSHLSVGEAEVEKLRLDPGERLDLPHRGLPLLYLLRQQVQELPAGQLGLVARLGHLMHPKLLEALTVLDADVAFLLLQMPLDVQGQPGLDTTELTVGQTLRWCLVKQMCQGKSKTLLYYTSLY